MVPNSSVVLISEATCGAALSSLMGISMNNDFDSSVIIDLADIYYTTTIDISSVFSSDNGIGGIALTFKSSLPIYSYIACYQDSEFVEKALENQVISSNASAGTYIFKNCLVYLEALIHILRNPDQFTFNGLFYVCPVFNGVITSGLKVIRHSVDNVEDVKASFKSI